MKIIISFIVILSTINFASAQIDTEYVNLIYSKIRSIQPQGRIYYGDKPDAAVLRYQFKYLYKNLHESERKNSKGGVSKFTAVERSYIINELKKSLHQQLPEDLFENSKRMDSDNIVPFIDKLNQRVIDSIHNITDKAQSLNARSHTYLYWSFSFINPIYIRKKTIFFTYFMYYSQVGGGNYFAIYKRQNGRWTQCMLVQGGAW